MRLFPDLRFPQQRIERAGPRGGSRRHQDSLTLGPPYRDDATACDDDSYARRVTVEGDVGQQTLMLVGANCAEYPAGILHFCAGFVDREADEALQIEFSQYFALQPLAGRHGTKYPLMRRQRADLPVTACSR